MIHMLTLTPKSIDPAKVAEIQANLISSLQSAEGILSIQISEGHLMSPGSPPAFSRVIQVSWQSLEKMMAWTQAPGTNNEDKDFLLSHGGLMLFYEVKEI